MRQRTTFSISHVPALQHHDQRWSDNEPRLDTQEGGRPELVPVPVSLSVSRPLGCGRVGLSHIWPISRL